MVKANFKASHPNEDINHINILFSKDPEVAYLPGMSIETQRPWKAQTWTTPITETEKAESGLEQMNSEIFSLCLTSK